MIALDYNNKDAAVAKLQKKGIDVRWDGWTLVFWREDRRGQSDPKGAQRNGVWGMETRIGPNDAGNWLIDYKLTRPKLNGV